MAELMVERSQTLEATSFEWPKVPQSRIESKEVPDEPLETLIEQKPEPRPLPREADSPTKIAQTPERFDKALEQFNKAQTQSSITNPSTASQKSVQATKTEISERRNTKLIPLFGSKKTQWPEPHLSLGTPCNRLGNNECWKAVGPAQDLFNLISKRIGDLLDERVEDLEEGEPVAGHILLFDMYMVGKSATIAQPTLLFTCQRTKPRRRAIKYIRESGILKGHPKILLAESSLPPLASGTSYLRLLSGTMPRRDVTPAPILTHTTKEPPLWIIAAVLVPFVAMMAAAALIFFARRKKNRSMKNVLRERGKSYEVFPRRTNGMYRKEHIDASKSSNFITRHIGFMHDKKRNAKASDPEVMERSDIESHPDSLFQGPLRLLDTNVPDVPDLSFPGDLLIKVGGVLNSKNTKPQGPALSSTPPAMAQVKVCEPAEPVSNGRYLSQDGSFGVPILCSATRKRATMGEVVHINEKYYGLTSAHTFAALLAWSKEDEIPSKYKETDPEFAFVHEDEEEDDGDISGVILTSQASMSSVDSLGLSRSNTTASTISHTEIENTVSTAATDTYVLRLDKEGQNMLSGQKPSIIGSISASSLSGTDPGLDWALIELSDQSFYDARYLNGLRNIWAGNSIFRQVISRSSSENLHRAVTVVTGYSGTIRGFLLPGSTAMKLTPRSKFQEVWTVQLEESIRSGDSGSFVVDAVNRDLCGHIIAGAPGGCLAYIIPASKVFEEIEKVLGGQVNILENFSSKTR